MIKYLIIALGVCHEISLHVLVHTYMFFAVCLLFVLILNVPVNIFQSCRDGATTFWVLPVFLGSNCVLHDGGRYRTPKLSLRSQTYFCDETNHLNAAVLHDNSLFTGILREPIGLQRMFCGIEERERRMLW